MTQDYKEDSPTSTELETNVDEVESTGTFESELRQRKQPTETPSSTPPPPPTVKKTPRNGKKKRPFINVAPLNTPLSHRLETLAVVWHCVSIPFFICLFLLTVSMGILGWVFIIFPYFIWWYGFDLHTPSNGKVAYRVRNSFKNFILWDWFVKYFPIEVHKTVDLEPTFSEIPVDDSSDSSDDDDEQDLVSEHSRTKVDKIFKFFGLKKRLNDTALGKPEIFKKAPIGPRYIFGYHPHGVISMGVVGLFANNALRNEPYTPISKWLKPFFHDSSKGERLFPGIGNIFPLTLTNQFALPFYRDYLMSLGITSASARNIRSLINNGDNSVCLVVGGAQESLLNNMIAKHARVGYGYKESLDIHGDESEEEEEEEENEKSKLDKSKSKREVQLVLNKRKGFVKLAIELGNVALVPIFAFGEADVYRLAQPAPGSFLYKFQQWMKATFHFTIPLFSARGVFIYDFGLLPFRNPINICVGRPVYIPPNVLKEYKQEHPEEFAEEESASVPMKKSGSITDMFKSGEKKVKTSSIKTKIPPALLDKYHKLYVDELKRVYEENKDKFGYGDVELNIVE